MRPEIVLADEPTGHLDSRTGEQIIELMKRSYREFDTTFIFSTHDPTIVSIADHVIHLGDGFVTSGQRRHADNDTSKKQLHRDARRHLRWLDAPARCADYKRLGSTVFALSGTGVACLRSSIFRFTVKPSLFAANNAVNIAFAKLLVGL
jgi:ABC-type methionine transport system ATPase subunit